MALITSLYPWNFTDQGALPAVLSVDETNKGGIVIISSQSAISPVVAYLTISTGFINSAEPWYIAGRFGVVNTGSAAARLAFGALAIVGNYVSCGYHQGASTTKWTAQFYDGLGTQNLVSTISIDTLLHDFEMWFDGTNVYFSVDGETPVSAVATHLLGDTMMSTVFHYRNGSENAPADCGIDKFLVMTGLPAGYAAPGP